MLQPLVRPQWRFDSVPSSHYLLITPTESLVLLHDDALSEAQDAELFGWHTVLRQSHLQYHGRFVEGFIGEAERSPMTRDRLPRLHVQMDLYCFEWVHMHWLHDPTWPIGADRDHG